MLRSIGVPELLVIAVVGGVFIILPWWKIFAKAGYAGALSLLMLVPAVNIVLLLFLGFGDWPVLKELRALRAPTPSQPPLLV
jgi:hypothetical protein